MSILVITEKPSVARMVAQALSCHEKCGGYIKGEGYIISWCFGHLIRKAAPEAYDMMYKKWDISMLPIIPERWIHEVIPQTKEQFKTLKTLMADQAVEQVCCCTDCGREGQLIFQLVYDMAGCRKPVSRFWASSLEEEAIRKAFASLRDGNEFIPLFQAAECRAEADWLIGMNLTRLYSLKYGNGRVLNIGRVKSPTLSLLAERETQISDFVKEPYYVTHLIMGDIDAVSPRISDKRKAEQMAEKLKNSQAFITAISKEKKKTMPPRLYDLTSLQRDANRIYGMTAKETLDAVQELYEEQLCTYPRTDSKFLTDDMADTAALVYMAIQKCSLAVIADIRPDTAPNIDVLLNSKRVTDHHAIIPTVRIGDPIRISKLNNQNEKILRLIMHRFLCAVDQPFLFESIQAEFNCDGDIFNAKGKTVLQEGWKKQDRVFLKKIRKNAPGEPEDENLNVLQDLTEGFALRVDRTKVTEHETKPPAHYTEESLLGAMERAGTEELNEDVERSGLGTTATRADIIESLIREGFVKRSGKTLLPTEDGMTLCSILPEHVKSASLTANWENRLTDIAQGKDTAEAFMENLHAYLREVTEDEKGKRVYTSGFQRPGQEMFGLCPHCGGRILKGKYGPYCEHRCGFRIGRLFGITLSDSQVQKMLEGKEFTLKNVPGKNGQPARDLLVTPEKLSEFSYVKDGEMLSGYQIDVTCRGAGLKQQKTKSDRDHNTGNDYRKQKNTFSGKEP